MARKRNKICLVCGKDYLGNEASFTCGNACRTYMSRLLKKGKKPEFWLVAKSKGQKIPLFFQSPIKKKKEHNLETDIDYKETTLESYDSKELSHTTMDEVGKTVAPMTKEQIAIEVSKLNSQIDKISREKCPLNRHPKTFILEQETKKSELEDKIKLLNGIS